MSDLTKITVNLTPSAEAALVTLSDKQRMTRTDALNRALRVAALMLDLAPEGHFTLVQADGSQDRVHLV